MSPYRTAPHALPLPPRPGLAARLLAAWRGWRTRRALAAWLRASAAIDAPFWAWRRTGDPAQRSRYRAALDREREASRSYWATLPPACPVGEPAAGEALPGGSARPEPVGGQLGPLAAIGQANPVGKRPGC